VTTTLPIAAVRNMRLMKVINTHKILAIVQQSWKAIHTLCMTSDLRQNTDLNKMLSSQLLRTNVKNVFWIKTSD